jgi:pimeloyl-ACP methyl ester carboxylesterase
MSQVASSDQPAPRVSRRGARRAGGLGAAVLATSGGLIPATAQEGTPVKASENQEPRPLLSEYPMWNEFGFRALAYALDHGADFGDCTSTIGRIPDGDVDAWQREWSATADRMMAIGDTALAAGDRISARDAYYRAANYYRIIQYPLYGTPVDPRLVAAFDASVAAFLKGAALSDFPIEPVEIPFEGVTLPGYMVMVDNSGQARPTIVFTNGWDSDIQEMFFAHAIAAVRRGYNALLFDGPGQGRNLIRDNMHLRPNWETVVTPVIDYALTRPEIDPQKIVLSGWSLGGYLAPRAAAFEHRIAALVADPGEWDERGPVLDFLPLTEEQKAAFPDIDPALLDEADAFLRSPEAPPMMHWAIVQRAFWVNNVDSLYSFAVDMLGYELSPYAANISCPSFISQAEDDSIAANAPKLYEAIKAPKVLELFSSADGAGMHCEMMARMLYNQRLYAWLNETLGVEG